MRVCDASFAKINESYSLCQSYRQVEIAFFSAIVTAACIFTSPANGQEFSKGESDKFLIAFSVHASKRIGEDAETLFDQLLIRWKLYAEAIYDCLRKGGPGSVYEKSDVTNLLDRQVIISAMENDDKAEGYACVRGFGVEWSIYETISAVCAIYDR